MPLLMLLVIAFVEDALSERDGLETGMSMVVGAEAEMTLDWLLILLWVLLQLPVLLANWQLASCVASVYSNGELEVTKLVLTNCGNGELALWFNANCTLSSSSFSFRSSAYVFIAVALAVIAVTELALVSYGVIVSVCEEKCEVWERCISLLFCLDVKQLANFALSSANIVYLTRSFK